MWPKKFHIDWKAVSQSVTGLLARDVTDVLSNPRIYTCELVPVWEFQGEVHERFPCFWDIFTDQALHLDK